MRQQTERTRRGTVVLVTCAAGLAAAAFVATRVSGQGFGQKPTLPPVAKPAQLQFHLIDPYGVSVSDSRTINLGAAEVTSTVVPPGKKVQCAAGRLLISNDAIKNPAQVVLLPLDNLMNAASIDAVFNDTPLGWATDDRRIKSNDHDLIALPNGDVLLIKMGQSRRPLDPKPVWFDYAYKLGDAWGPGARSEIFVWRSADCGASFDYVSSIDTATVPDGHGTLEDWSGGLPQPPKLHPFINIWQMGGTDGPLARVDPATGHVYVTLKLAGHLPTATNPLDLGASLNRTVVMKSSDGGSSWFRVALMMRGVWRLDVVPRPDGTLAFADSGQKPANEGGGHVAYVIPSCQPGCIADPGAPNTAFEAPEPQGAHQWDQSAWNHPLLYNADDNPANDDPTDFMDTNVAGQTILTRSPNSHNLLLAYMDTIEDGRGDGYRAYWYDGAAAWHPLNAIAPKSANPDNFVLHVTPVDPGRGPLLFYWYDVNTTTNRAAIRGRLVTGENGQETFNFAISRSGGLEYSFDVTQKARWYGDYHTAGAYYATSEGFFSHYTYHYYPVWVEPDGDVHVSHVTFETPVTISRAAAELLGYLFPSGRDRIIHRQEIDFSRLVLEPSIEEEDFRIRIPR